MVNPIINLNILDAKQVKHLDLHLDSWEIFSLWPYCKHI
jgi:hypothetical protein